MAETTDNLRQQIRFFEEKLATHGATPRGLDFNNIEAVHARYRQILRAVTHPSGFSLNDFGCGYGGLVDYLQTQGYSDFSYSGYDVTDAMIVEARQRHQAPHVQFVTGDQLALTSADYTVASGVFNIRLATTQDDWAAYVRECLTAMYEASTQAMSATFLTGYSDADRKRDDLYYPDPGDMFAFAKSLSRNVAILHDYDLYDFTLIIRRVAF